MSPLFDDTDDDIPLRSHREDGGEYASARAPRAPAERSLSTPADREFTLNTGVVLALFFALALLCAVFFGFGYSIGHKSAASAVASDAGTSTTSAADITPATASTKPSPGSPAPAVPSYIAPGSERTATAEPKPAAAAPRESATPARTTPAATGTDAATTTRPAAPVVRVPPASSPSPAVPAAVPVTIPPTTAPTGGSTYVQVAAVSHQEDADVLLSALRRRGYAVITRTDPADHLIHVQIGPYAGRKDAEAMRQRLIGDGYNAFVK